MYSCDDVSSLDNEGLYDNDDIQNSLNRTALHMYKQKLTDLVQNVSHNQTTFHMSTRISTKLTWSFGYHGIKLQVTVKTMKYVYLFI